MYYTDYKLFIKKTVIKKWQIWLNFSGCAEHLEMYISSGILSFRKILFFKQTA